MSFADDVANGLRARGVFVHFADGYQGRGNGSNWNGPQGGIMHHTASAYGKALPGTGIYNVLCNGRPDLDGPLCNSAGNDDGSITIIAAYPANHAGAAGGDWARPFPDTRSFNNMVWGHEIVYPGVSPMTPAQWSSMVILGQVLCQLLNRGPEWIKGHYETSVDGKWDPGFAEGKWIDMNEVRRQIGAGGGEADDMFSDDDRWFLDDIFEQITGTRDIGVVRSLGHFPGFEGWVNGAKHTPLDFTRYTHVNNISITAIAASLEAEANKQTALLANQTGEDEAALLAAIDANIAAGVHEAQVEVSVEYSKSNPAPSPTPTPPPPSTT